MRPVRAPQDFKPKWNEVCTDEYTGLKEAHISGREDTSAPSIRKQSLWMRSVKYSPAPKNTFLVYAMHRHLWPYIGDYRRRPFAAFACSSASTVRHHNTPRPICVCATLRPTWVCATLRPTWVCATLRPTWVCASLHWTGVQVKTHLKTVLCD